MTHIKVVWRDTKVHEGKAYTHRKQTIKGYREGWITDLEGDDNIYKTCDSAKNAIDNVLGDKGKRRDAGKRAAEGIRIIGKISEHKRSGETA